MFRIVMKKDVENQLDQPCEKGRRITWYQGAKERSAYNKMKEGELLWPHLA
jgi:hypothetical protein